METTPTEYGTITCSIQHGDPHTEEIVVSTYDDLSGDNISSSQSDDQMGEQVLGYLEVQPSDTDNATIILQPQGIEIDGQRLILTQGEVGNEIIVVVSSDQDSISEQTVAHFSQSGHHLETSSGHPDLIDDSSDTQLEVIETEVCEVPHDSSEIQQVFIEQNGKLSAIGVDIPNSLGDSVEIGSSAWSIKAKSSDEKDNVEKILYLPMQSSKKQSANLQSSLSLNSSEEKTPNLMQLACIAQEIHSANQKSNQYSSKPFSYSESYDSSTDNEGHNTLVVQDSIDLSANSQSIICATEYDTDYLGTADASSNDFDTGSSAKKINDNYVDSDHPLNNTVSVIESSSDDSNVIQIESNNENVEYEDNEIPVEGHSHEILDENLSEKILSENESEEIIESPVEEIIESQAEEIIESQDEEIIESQAEEIIESSTEEIFESPTEEIIESQSVDESQADLVIESQADEVIESQGEVVENQVDEVVESETYEIIENQADVTEDQYYDHSVSENQSDDRHVAEDQSDDLHVAESQSDDLHVAENVQSSYPIEDDKLQFELSSEGDNMEIDLERECSQPSNDGDELLEVKCKSDKMEEKVDQNLVVRKSDIESNDSEAVEIERSKIINSGINEENKSSSKEPDVEVEKSNSSQLLKDRSTGRSTRSQKPHILNIPKKRKISEIFYDSEDNHISHKKELKEKRLDADLNSPKDVDNSITQCTVEAIIEQPMSQSRTRSRKSNLKNNESKNIIASPNRTTRSGGQNRKSTVKTSVIDEQLDSYEKETTIEKSSETSLSEASQKDMVAEDNAAVSEPMVIDEPLNKEKNSKSQRPSRISRGRPKKISSQNESSAIKDIKTASDHKTNNTNDKVSIKADFENPELSVVSADAIHLADVSKQTTMPEEVKLQKSVHETRARRTKKKDNASSDVSNVHPDSNFETNNVLLETPSLENINADAKVDMDDKNLEDVDINCSIPEKKITARTSRSRHSRKRNSKSHKSVDIIDQSNVDSDISTINSDTLQKSLLETPEETIETVTVNDKQLTEAEHKSHLNKTKPNKIATPSRSTRARSARNKESDKSSIGDPIIHSDLNSELNDIAALGTKENVDSDVQKSDSQQEINIEQTAEISENIPLRKTRARHIKRKSSKTDSVCEQSEEMSTTKIMIEEKVSLEVTANTVVSSIENMEVDEPIAHGNKNIPSSEKVNLDKRSTRARRTKKSTVKESGNDVVQPDSDFAMTDTNSRTTLDTSQDLNNDSVDHSMTEKSLDVEPLEESHEKQNRLDDINESNVPPRKTRASLAKKRVVKSDSLVNTSQSDSEKNYTISSQEKNPDFTVSSDQPLVIDDSDSRSSKRRNKTVLNEKANFAIPKQTVRTRQTKKSSVKTDSCSNASINSNDEIPDARNEHPPSSVESIKISASEISLEKEIDLNESTEIKGEDHLLDDKSSKDEIILESASIEVKRTYGKKKNLDKQQSDITKENNAAELPSNSITSITVDPNENLSTSMQDDLDVICSNSEIIASEENLVITPKKTYTRKNKLKSDQNKEETTDLQNIKLFSCDDIMSDVFEPYSDKQETVLNVSVSQENIQALDDTTSLQPNVEKKATPTSKRKRKLVLEKPETTTRNLRLRVSREIRKEIEEPQVVESPSDTTILNKETSETGNVEEVAIEIENTAAEQNVAASNKEETLPPKKRHSKASKNTDKSNSSWEKLVKSSPAKFAHFKPINKKKLKEKVQKQFMSLCDPSPSKTSKRGRQKKQVANTVVEIREPAPVYRDTNKFVSKAKRYDFVRERIQKSCGSSSYRTPYTCSNCTYSCYRIDNIIAHNRVCFIDPDTDMIDYSLDDMNRRQLIRGVDTKSVEEETSHSNDMSNGVAESFNGDRDNSQQSGNFSDYEGEEDMPSFSDEVKRKHGFSEKDVVWVKVKNAFWPGLVCRLYHKDRKASVVLIDSPLQRKGFKIKIKKLLSFNDAEINKKILDDVGNSSDPESFLKSAQKAENYFRKKRILRCDVEPKSFFGIDCDSADDFQYSYESCSSNESDEEEEDGDQLSPKDSELKDYEEVLSDYEEITDSKSTDKHIIEIDTSKLLNCLMEGQVNDHMVEIINETIKSERHTKFFSSNPVDKDEVKQRSGFGPIDSSEHSKIFDHFHNLFKNCSDRGDEDPSIVIPYVYEVWVPEAIIKAMSLIQDISREEAEMIFESDVSTENTGHISIAAIEERYK